MRSRRELIVGHQRSNPIGDETPGLNTVSDTDSAWDDWYEPASVSRNVPGFHEELAQRVAASASVSANLPTSQPVIHREERSEVPP